MTISLETTKSDIIDCIKLRSHIVYDWLDVEKEFLPISVRSHGGTMEIYITDDFAKFIVEYFSEWFIGILNTSGKKKAEQVAKEFRQKGEQFFVSNIVLH